jgi:hypothetical protein
MPTIIKEMFQSPEASWEQQAAMWALVRREVELIN